MSNQSTEAVRPRTKVGVSTTPTDQVSEVSGFRAELPPTMFLHCADGHSESLPYWAAVTPVRMHCCRVSTGVAPEQGSWKPNSTLLLGAKDSSTLGALTARW